MNLVDTKLPPEKDGKVLEQPTAPQRDRWPYGLKLDFESDIIRRLPHLKDMKVGDKVTISAIGEVVKVEKIESNNTYNNYKNRFDISIQLKKVGVEPSVKTPGSLANDMKRMRQQRTYGNDSEFYTKAFDRMGGSGEGE